MYRAVWARAVFFLSAFLLLTTILILQGCATELFSMKLTAAEEKLSHGKASEENLKKEKAPILPPSVATRYRLAVIMDGLIRGENSLGTVQAELKRIRDDALTTHDLKVEAGYLLTLVEKMETLQKTANAQTAKNKECAKEGDELKKAYDQLKKENEDIKKEAELLSYKLKKLEQIHIETEKRRGTQ